MEKDYKVRMTSHLLKREIKIRGWKAKTMSIDEYYELLQLGIMFLGIAAVILAFLFVGYEKS